MHKNKKNLKLILEVRALPRLFGLYPGICLTTDEKAWTPSVRVVEKCPDIPMTVVQYTFTHKQYPEQHNETEYTKRLLNINISTYI
jgi:hypothetical protein